MKQFFAILLLSIAFAACNNSAETTKTSDSTNVDVNTRTPVKDTSSYDRMPNKITDSTQH